MSSRKIGRYTEAELLNAAKTAVERKTKGSVVLDPKAETEIPKFQTSELELGKVLGRGGFCVVYEIPKISLSKGKAHATKNSDEDHIHNIVQTREFMASHYVRKGKDYRYAMKIIQDSVRKEPDLFVNAVVDLAVEARFLAVIRHPNIIKMRAMSSGSPYDSSFFIVLDRLFEIMPARIARWKKRIPGGMSFLTDPGGKKSKDLWSERLIVAFDLSIALKHLHEHHVVYRDLKPDNIGFDVRGDVKIFDFGLARELEPKLRAKDETFELTGDTGSPRYMAPEVAMGLRYNEKCDVYSLAILLWQMLKLETPFEKFTMKMFAKNVVKGGTRPKPDDKWSSDVQNLLRSGWNVKLSQRPFMADFSHGLQNIIAKETNEHVQDAVDISGKSEMSARRG